MLNIFINKLFVTSRHHCRFNKEVVPEEWEISKTKWNKNYSAWLARSRATTFRPKALLTLLRSTVILYWNCGIPINHSFTSPPNPSHRDSVPLQVLCICFSIFVCSVPYKGSLSRPGPNSHSNLSPWRSSIRKLAVKIVCIRWKNWMTLVQRWSWFSKGRGTVRAKLQ